MTFGQNLEIPGLHFCANMKLRTQPLTLANCLNSFKVKVMASRVSSLETSAWQQRSIKRSNLENILKSCCSSAICVVTVERSKSCDTISFVKL